MSLTRPDGRPVPVGRTHLPLRTAVHDEVRRRITDGTYGQGERLYEEQIAAELQVSRNPVREALQQLAAEGFVELLPRRGARVAIISAERARELFEVRESLERLVAELAAHRCQPEQLDQLRRDVADGLAAVERRDHAALPALNTRFHHTFAAAANNALLADMLDQLSHVIEWVYTKRIARRGVDSWIEHGQIVEAIAAGDPDAAMAHAKTHITNAQVAYEDES